MTCKKGRPSYCSWSLLWQTVLNRRNKRIFVSFAKNRRSSILEMISYSRHEWNVGYLKVVALAGLRYAASIRFFFFFFSAIGTVDQKVNIIRWRICVLDIHERGKENVKNQPHTDPSKMMSMQSKLELIKSFMEAMNTENEAFKYLWESSMCKWFRIEGKNIHWLEKQKPDEGFGAEAVRKIPGIH